MTGPRPGAELLADFEAARAIGDVEAMAGAVLALASAQPFGVVPGKLPALLHEAYTAARGEQRALLAVALARTWTYGGSPERGAPFAAEALALAEGVGDPGLLAAALDAELLSRWGPDDLDERVALSERLEEVAAHLPDVELRLRSHLWRLTTALETLDLARVRRQLRSIDALAQECPLPRMRFFAASRRGMYALLVGDLDLAERERQEAVAMGEEAGEPDAQAIDHALKAAIARQAGDAKSAAREAVEFEAFGDHEGAAAVSAEAATLWVVAGEQERARKVLHQVAGADMRSLPRDVDWLHVVSCLASVACATGELELAAHARALLTPYAGRGVVDAGAVGFAGVVDHYLADLARVLGDDAAAEAHSEAAAEAYRRLGAGWWLRQLDAPSSPTATGVVHFRPLPTGMWQIGSASAAPLPDLRGLHYLRLLLQRPGLDIPAAQLSDAVAGHVGAGVREEPTGPLLDRKALVAYRQRLSELDEETEQARSWSDTGRLARLESEREALLSELRAATGLGGASRSGGDGTAERARVAVRKAVKAAIERIAGVDAALARLLSDTVSTGGLCRYEPDPHRPVSWQLDG